METFGMRFELALYAIRQRGNAEYDRHLTWYWKAWYTVKVLLCLMLQARSPTISWSDFCDKRIHVAILSSGKSFNGEYTEYWYDSLNVGEGIFQNWWWHYSSDS